MWILNACTKIISVSFLTSVLLPGSPDFASCSIILKSMVSQGEWEFSVLLICTTFGSEFKNGWSGPPSKQKCPQTTFALSLLWSPYSRTWVSVRLALDLNSTAGSALIFGALVMVCSIPLNKIKISPCSAKALSLSFGTSYQNSPWVTMWNLARFSSCGRLMPQSPANDVLYQ